MAVHCQWAVWGNLWVVWGRVSGIHSIDRAEFTRPMQLQNWPCREGFYSGEVAAICRLPWKRDRQKRIGGCPSSPHSNATQFSPSLYVSYTSQSADPPLKPRVHVCKQVSLCMGSEFSGSFYFTQMTRLLTDFLQSDFVEIPLPRAGTLGWRASVWG